MVPKVSGAVDTLEPGQEAVGRPGTTLEALVEHLRTTFTVSVRGSLDGATVLDASHDSGHRGTGWLFCCLPGSRTHGIDHAAEALEGGAVALLTDVASADIDERVPQIVVGDIRRAVAHAAAHVHGHPSRRLSVVGVTGTNGKTTTAAMIASILRAAGATTGEIGTLHGERTTPEATDFQRFLARQRDAGMTHVVAEVSSHALALHRVDATEFAVGVFTNLGRDHLDFHGTEEEYFVAKSQLFRRGLCRDAVINVDDRRGREIAEMCDCPVTAVRPADASVTHAELTGSAFRWSGLDIRTGLAGRFNIDNAVLAAAVGRVLGLPDDAIVRGIAECRGVRGRFSVLGGGESPTVVVDYAHTPDGLEMLLDAARRLTPGRLVVVFGCGGDRDRGKRPEMGRIASTLADSIVVTSDNPRSEDPLAIAADILDGIRPADRERVVVDIDRASAIARAVDGCGAGDTVVIAGKGHESTQEFGDHIVEFDDLTAASRILADRNGDAR